MNRDELKAYGAALSQHAAACAQTIAANGQCAVVIMLDPSGVSGVGISGQASAGDLHAILETLAHGFELQSITPTQNGNVIEIDREGRRQ